LSHSIASLASNAGWTKLSNWWRQPRKRSEQLCDRYPAPSRGSDTAELDTGGDHRPRHGQMKHIRFRSELVERA
jgi:hypothetical protein